MIVIYKMARWIKSVFFFVWKKGNDGVFTSKKYSLVVLAKVHRLLEFVLKSVTPMV